MKEGQSFAEYVGVVEATLGAKADPDRAYEAFTAGVSPEVFVKSVVRNSVKEVPSNLPPESISRSFKIGPSGDSFRAADQNITPRQGLIAVFVVALSIIVLSSIWIPIETAKIKKRNEPLPSVPLGPSPRLVTAKVLIRGALNSKDAQRLQAA